jgi:predicted Zn-dependent protease
MKKLSVFLCICLFLSFKAARLEGQIGIPGPWGGGSFDSLFGSNGSDADFTLEEAYYLGRAVAANILTTYRPYNGNPELTRYLNRICMTIAINSSQPTQFNGYHVVILDSPEFNAFATPGGHILVTRGLVEATTSEDMLAALIAHELAHIILRHGTGIISEMRIHNELGAIANQAAAIAGNAQIAAFRNSVSSVVDAMVKNGYSRPQEFAADSAAASLLAASGYNPGAFVDLLRILQRVQPSQRGGFNTTHPSPAERIANVEGTIARLRVQDTRSFRAPRFKNR